MTLTRKNVTELLWTGVGQIGSILLGILTIKIITMVGSGEYGVFVLATSITGVLSLAFFGPMEQGFVRNYFDFSRDPRRRSLFLAYLIKVLLFAVVGFLFLFGAAGIILHQQFDLQYPFLAAAAFMVVLTASSVPVTGMLNAFRMRKEVASTQLGEKLMTLVLLGALLLVGDISITNIMACIALSAACMFFVRLKVYEKVASENGGHSEGSNLADRDLTREIVRRILTYSLPFVGWGFISWIQLSGERWIMGGMLSTSDVGRYGLGVTLIQSSAVVAFNVLSQYVSPIIYEKYSDPTPGMRARAFGIIRTCSWITVALFLSASIFFYFGGALIIQLVSKPEFATEPVLLLALTIGLGFFYLGQMMTLAGMAAQRPQIYVAPKIVSALLSLGSYVAGCMIAGVEGIILAVVFANGAYAGLVAFTNHRNKLFAIERE